MRQFKPYSLAWLLVLSCSSGTGNGNSGTQSSKPPASDVGFMVEHCKGEGYSKEQCECMGAEAEKLLAKEMIEKMRNTPKDESEEALRKYYTPDERETLMSFLSQMSITCKFNEGGQQ